jgi:hypothetical protein
MLIVMHKVNHNMYTPSERFLGILQDALVPKLLCSMCMLLPLFVVVYTLFEIWWGMLTWTICELLEGRKAVKRKWVHKVKCKSDGSIEGSDCYRRIWDWLWGNVFMSCQAWLHQDNLLMTALLILQKPYLEDMDSIRTILFTVATSIHKNLCGRYGAAAIWCEDDIFAWGLGGGGLPSDSRSLRYKQGMQIGMSVYT